MVCFLRFSRNWRQREAGSSKRTLWLIFLPRNEHKPCAIQLHADVQPRSSHLLYRLRRWLRKRKGQSEELDGKQRMYVLARPFAYRPHSFIILFLLGVINIISEHFIEAANATSINAPYGVSEWALSGLHPASCTEVACSRVQEAVFAVECKLIDTKEFESRNTPGKKTGVIATVEGLKFWVREDAINKEKNLVDQAVLRPMSRLGGITYARVTQGLELPRPDYDESVKKAGKEDMVVPKIEGQ